MEKISLLLARSIGGRLEFDEEKIRVVAYGLSALGQAILLFLIALTAGILTGYPVEFMISFFAAGLLRRTVGGAHMSSYLGCIIFSSAMIALLGLCGGIFAPKIPAAILACVYAALYGFCAVAVIKYAPLDSPNKPIVSREKIKKLRRGAFMTLLIYVSLSILSLPAKLYGSSAALTLSASWQCFAITPFGHTFINLINNMPFKIFERRFKP